MLSLLIKTFEQILKNGEQIQNVENFFKVLEKVLISSNLNSFEKVLISFDINSYMFKSYISMFQNIFIYLKKFSINIENFFINMEIFFQILKTHFQILGNNIIEINYSNI